MGQCVRVLSRITCVSPPAYKCQLHLLVWSAISSCASTPCPHAVGPACRAAAPPPLQEVLSAFGFTQYEVNLSTRPEKHVGEPEIWDVAEDALRNALGAKGWNYVVDEGGGAFYGPKIDIKIQDAIGRKWQCSTIQLDFNLPQR